MDGKEGNEGFRLIRRNDQLLRELQDRGCTALAMEQQRILEEAKKNIRISLLPCQLASLPWMALAFPVPHSSSQASQHQYRFFERNNWDKVIGKPSLSLSENHIQKRRNLPPPSPPPSQNPNRLIIEVWGETVSTSSSSRSEGRSAWNCLDDFGDNEIQASWQ